MGGHRRRALVAAALAIAACAAGDREAGAGGAAAGALPPSEGPAPAGAGRTFVCSDGRPVVIRLDVPAGVAILVREGAQTIFMAQAGRAPPRYVAGETTLELSPGEARFTRLRRRLSTCAERPEAPTRGAIWGTLVKLDRAALPPGTRAKVMLVDAARADAPAVEVAATELVTDGNQVPLHFLIRYDPDRVPPRGQTWRLSARLFAPDGRLLYVTDGARFVLEGSDPEPPAELLLVPVRRGS